MKRIKVKSLESGIVLGYLLETKVINGVKEYVIERGNGRFFLRHNNNLQFIQ